MALYAHAVLEGADKKFQRGDEVPADAFSDEDRENFLEYDALSEEPYDPAADVNEPPQFIEIDGVRYAKESE